MIGAHKLICFTDHFSRTWARACSARYTGMWARPLRCVNVPRKWCVNHLPNGARHGRTCRIPRTRRWPSSTVVYSPIKTCLLLNPPCAAIEEPRHRKRKGVQREGERDFGRRSFIWRERQGRNDWPVTRVIGTLRDPVRLGHRVGGQWEPFRLVKFTISRASPPQDYFSSGAVDLTLRISVRILLLDSPSPP